MHRILLINHYAGSPRHGMEFRPYHFAREWARAGHGVLVVAASFSHLRQKNPEVRKTLTCETVEGVDYLWVRTPSYEGNGARRALNMATFVARLYGSCGKTIAEFRPDLVIASSTYTWDNWPAAHYAREHGARYVYELHDVWPLSPMELRGMSPMHPFIWSLQRAEDFACRHADRVVSLLPATREHLVERGMPPERFAYIPNGVCEEEWAFREPAPAGHVEAIRAYREGKRCLVGYVGGHNFSDPLEPLVEAGAGPELSEIGIVLIGNGAKKTALEEMARASGSRTLFLPPVAKPCVPALLGLFDILFIGWPRSPLYRFGIASNKLCEYMMSGVPIVHAVEAANDPVQEAGCGLSIPPEDLPALIEAIRHLAALSPGARHEMGERGRRYTEELHTVGKLARRFLEAVWEPESTTGPGQGPGAI
jgi:glycosyltransferase involved in cell wall biosynthesis